MTTSNLPLRVAIIGAGPGGCTLASILQQQIKSVGFDNASSSIQITIYEHDESPNARSQGGSLDLHPDTAQLALKAAGLLDQFNVLSRPEDDEDHIFDQHGVSKFERKSDDASEGRPEIDRTQLRDLLLSAIHPDTIKWGHTLRSASRIDGSPKSEYELKFASGFTTTADVVIGADGAWSRIRSLLTPAVPVYTGICFYDCIIKDASKRQPALSQFLGRGLAFILGDNRGFLTQWSSSDVLRVYVAVRKSESWIDDEISLEDTRSKLLREFIGFKDDFLGIIKDADELKPRKIYALPVESYKHKPQPALALLGDAAHVMSPFAGEGVNLAMADALDLANALIRVVRGESKLEDAFETYHDTISERAAKAGRESASNLDIIFHRDAPQPLVDLMESYNHDGPPPAQ